MRASASLRVSIASATAKHSFARSHTDRPAIFGFAALAAAIARCASARGPSGTKPPPAPAAGLVPSRNPPEPPSPQRPPMRMRLTGAPDGAVVTFRPLIVFIGIISVGGLGSATGEAVAQAQHRLERAG